LSYILSGMYCIIAVFFIWSFILIINMTRDEAKYLMKYSSCVDKCATTYKKDANKKRHNKKPKKN
jgi:hypothetical protein